MGLLNENLAYYLFPEQIDICASEFGLQTPVKRLNEERDEKKPILSENQIELVIKQYYDDNELYKNLKEKYHAK
jgi:hypothetical protein